MAGKITLNTKGLDKLRAELRPRAARIVARTAFLVQDKAQRLAPVDTGALRNSIMAMQTGDLTWEISAGVEYAGFVEWGTSRTRAQPFMTPAVEGQRAAFERSFSDLLKL